MDATDTRQPSGILVFDWPPFGEPYRLLGFKDEHIEPGRVPGTVSYICRPAPGLVARFESSIDWQFYYLTITDRAGVVLVDKQPHRTQTAVANAIKDFIAART